MSVKISIPASELIELKKDPLILKLGQRCSRCDQSPAEFYEIHRISLHIGAKKNRLVSKKYDISRSFKLKINVCETCYQSDFLSHPEKLDRNGSRLSRIALFHSVTWALGGFFAGCGFLLLTPLVPDTGVLQSIKSIWQIPILVGILVLLLTWFSQKKYQNKVLQELERSTPNFHPRKRAEVNAPILESSKDLSITALEITMENEPWAMETAKSHGWMYETTA